MSNQVQDIMERPVKVRVGGAENIISTAEALLLVLRNKAASGDVRAAALMEKLQDLSGLGSRMTDEAREKHSLRLPNASTLEETFLMIQPQWERDRQRYLAMAEFTGDHDEYEPPRPLSSAIKSADNAMARDDLGGTLEYYRAEIDRCKAELTAKANNSVAQYDFYRVVARIGLVANKLLLEGDFAKALAVAEEALHEASSSFYSVPKGPFSDASIMAAGERTRWIALLRANALMLLDRVEEARRMLLDFGVHDKRKAPLAFSWEDGIFRQFAQLRRAGHSHYLMTEIEAEFFRNRRVRDRAEEVLPRGLPHEQEIRMAEAMAQKQPAEALAIYRGLLERTDSASERYLLANRLGVLAWHFLMQGNYSDALTCAEMGLRRDPYSTTLNINRAHALMFLNQAEEARATYFAYYDKLMTDAEWAHSAIQKDFNELRKAGFDNPLMREVEARYSDATWGKRLGTSLSVLGENTTLPIVKPDVLSVPPVPLADRDDLQSADQLMMDGRLQDAFRVCERRIEISKRIMAKGVPNLQAPEDRHAAVIQISEIATMFVCDGLYDKALEVSDYALSEVPGSALANIRRAHALLHLGREAEARQLYLQFRTAKVAPGCTGADVICEDFRRFRTYGGFIESMDDIERMMKPVRELG